MNETVNEAGVGGTGREVQGISTEQGRFRLLETGEIYTLREAI